MVLVTTIFLLSMVTQNLFFLLDSFVIIMQPQWMAPEVLRNDPSNEKYTFFPENSQILFSSIGLCKSTSSEVLFSSISLHKSTSEIAMEARPSKMT